MSACTHKEHQILTTAEAASFANQFWDRKAHPTKASRQEFLATCIDVDLEKNVKVWVKSGYSETIAWRKVQLTKQRNVDLTTDGLWAMPLNTGWVPVKARRLQDWEKLKKYAPIHKQGDVCPNGVPALVEGGNNRDDSDSEESVVPRALPCLVHRPLCSSICSKM